MDCEVGFGLSCVYLRVVRKFRKTPKPKKEPFKIVNLQN